MNKNQIWIKDHWLFVISFGVIVVTTIPYMIGFGLESNNYLFSGFIIGVEDGNSYLAKMLIGSSGKWLFTTPYTAYPQKGFFAFFPYILLGKLASNPEMRLQQIQIFHLFRMLGIFFLVYETFKFSREFLGDEKKSYLATFVLIFGGGFGWFGILFPEMINHRMPLEFYSPETFGFLAAFSLPHLLFGRALLYKSFRSVIMNHENPESKRKTLINGGIWLLLSGVFQPLNLVIGWIVAGAYWIYKFFSKKKKISELLPMIIWYIPSLPLLLYNFLSFRFDPVLSSWQSQNVIPSPPIIDYLIAYGLGLIAIGVGYQKKWFNRIKHAEFLFIWILVLPLLIYSPLNIQRRLSEGVWLCFSIFIVYLLLEMNSKVLRSILILFVSLPSLLFIFGSINSVLNVSRPIFIPTTLVDVTETIRAHAEINDVVLAPFYESNVLPSFIPVKVLTGHGPESMNNAVIQKKIEKFYQGELESYEVKELIEKFNVRFIVFLNKEEYMKSQNLLTPFHIIKLDQNSDYYVVKIDE